MNLEWEGGEDEVEEEEEIYLRAFISESFNGLFFVIFSLR